MVVRKEKLKRCLPVQLLLCELKETENKVSNQGKTREWIRRRQGSGYLRNIVQELAAKDMPASRQIMRKKFEHLIVIFREIEADVTSRQVPKRGLTSAAEQITAHFLGFKQPVSMVTT